MNNDVQVEEGDERKIHEPRLLTWGKSRVYVSKGCPLSAASKCGKLAGIAADIKQAEEIRPEEQQNRQD